MVTANEINSTFYAMRLLSHHIDISEIDVSRGEEYPANEFSPEEQTRALEIIRELEIEQQTSFTQDYGASAEPVVKKLADRIETLATNELAGAGYETSTPESLGRKSYKALRKRDKIETTIDGAVLLEGLIGKLTSDDRQILELMFLGHSITDVANSLNITPADAKRKWRRIAMKLARYRRRKRVSDKTIFLTHSEPG
jgi:ATP/maltotriose-dependent transcriptional regulator MalT